MDISSERAEEFARRMTAELQGTHGARITHAATPEEAMAGAAVVTTVTTATSPVFDGSLLAEGAHLNAVGSYTPQMCEVDPVALLRADKIYCDTRDALVESGDIQVPLEEGRFDLDRVTGELGDVLLGRVPGRESASEITFFECTGSAVLDVVVGRRIYETALATGAGTSIDL